MYPVIFSYHVFGVFWWKKLLKGKKLRLTVNAKKIAKKLKLKWSKMKLNEYFSFVTHKNDERI